MELKALNLGVSVYTYNDWLLFQEYENTESPKTKSLEVDTFSNLPTDVLNEVMRHLPLRELNALKLTSKGIKLLSKNHFPLATQNFLENLLVSILEDSYVKRILSNESHLDFKEKYEILLNGSEEKCQALRAFICSIFYGHTTMYSAIEMLKPLHFYDDHFLPPFIIKNIGINDESFFQCGLGDHDYEIFNLSLDMLEKNRLNPEVVDFWFGRNSFLSKQTLGKILKIIRKNVTLKELQFTIYKWNYSDLKTFLDAINDNAQIRKISICERSFHPWSDEMWFWECEVQIGV